MVPVSRQQGSTPARRASARSTRQTRATELPCLGEEACKSTVLRRHQEAPDLHGVQGCGQEQSHHECAAVAVSEPKEVYGEDHHDERKTTDDQVRGHGDRELGVAESGRGLQPKDRDQVASPPPGHAASSGGEVRDVEVPVREQDNQSESGCEGPDPDVIRMNRKGRRKCLQATKHQECFSCCKEVSFGEDSQSRRRHLRSVLCAQDCSDGAKGGSLSG